MIRRRFRSSITGRIVKAATAKRHPDTTVGEMRVGRVHDVELEQAARRLVDSARAQGPDDFLRYVRVVGQRELDGLALRLEQRGA